MFLSGQTVRRGLLCFDKKLNPYQWNASVLTSGCRETSLIMLRSQAFVYRHRVILNVSISDNLKDTIALSLHYYELTTVSAGRLND